MVRRAGVELHVARAISTTFFRTSQWISQCDDIRAGVRVCRNVHIGVANELVGRDAADRVCSYRPAGDPGRKADPLSARRCGFHVCLLLHSEHPGTNRIGVFRCAYRGIPLGGRGLGVCFHGRRVDPIRGNLLGICDRDLVHHVVAYFVADSLDGWKRRVLSPTPRVCRATHSRAAFQQSRQGTPLPPRMLSHRAEFPISTRAVDECGAVTKAASAIGNSRAMADGPGEGVHRGGGRRKL